MFAERRRSGRETGARVQVFVPWVHILSFSVWLGANVFVLGVLLPASRRLPAGARRDVLRRAGRGLNRVAAAAAPLAILSGVGGLLLPGAPSPLAAADSGSLLALGAKSVLTAVMALNHALQAFRYDPAPEGPPDDAARNPWLRLLAANVALGTVVFLLGLYLNRTAV